MRPGAGGGGAGQHRAIDAVVFDLGGVVLESPFTAIARYEAELGLPPQSINRAVAGAGEAGAWARLERGEITLEAFYTCFDADCRAAGLAVSVQRLMALVHESTVVRPRMVGVIDRLRRHGLRVGALTNTWVRQGRTVTESLRPHFDVFVESSTVGLRKPDPRIYELVCRELGVPPARAAFLDDLGRNLKAARALGMTTIKVDDPAAALCELGALLGFDLLG